MNLFFDGVLVAISDESFIAKDTGEKVPYFLNIFQCEDTTGKKNIVQVHGKEDYSELLGDTVVATVVARERDGGGFRITLQGVQTAELTISPIKQ